MANKSTICSPAMPLCDHFHYPANKRARWNAVYGMLPGTITRRLNDLLPPQHAAGPRVHLGSIKPYRVPAPVGGPDNDLPGEWSPPEPTIAAMSNWSDVDDYEVVICDRESRQDVYAAIGIVAPSNKDRSEHRRSFMGKCSTLLRQGAALTIIDFVTDPAANLYGELVEWIGHPDPSLCGSISAATLRERLAKRGRVMDAWYYPLAVGEPLPTLPIWLTEYFAVPLELEPIYEETLRSLRMR